MARGSNKLARPATPAGPPNPSPSPSPTAAEPNQDRAGWKRMCFRLLAMIGVPVFLLAVVELGLRAAGFGYPTGFLLPYSEDGNRLYVQNNQFGWRFFGPAMSREPDSFAFPCEKGPKTVRIFVFGESAAYGDPNPAFGLPRMIEALLELRHPGVKFEVINAAVTAINSNVILPIARDCASADGDVWVIYMGNNEVVGPFGAGTVFGPQAPPVPLIRASLTLKATRLGELADDIRRWLRPPPSSKSEWGGMEMFLDQQLRADDPRMNAVYQNFQRNLADIIAVGRRHGAGVVVSTIPVNLRDSAPFGSSHRLGLSGVDLDQWKAHYQRGIDMQNATNWDQAAASFSAAAAIDDTYAELRYRQAICAVAMGASNEARTNFSAARDQDTLRFRCDTRLNDIIRQTASAAQDPGVALVDADNLFDAVSPYGAPGNGLFYEHVHLTVDGNYLLAKSIAPAVEKLLPKDVVPVVPSNQPWASDAECCARLAWNGWSYREAVSDILERLHEPPFTTQMSHDTQTAYWKSLLARIPDGDPTVGLGADAPLNGVTNSLKRCEAASANWPDDAMLHELVAGLRVLKVPPDLVGAVKAGRDAVSLRPTSAADWSQLGVALGQSGKLNEAADAFSRACALDPEDVGSRCNLAHAYDQLGQREAAIREYRRAVAAKPRFGPGWLALGNELAANKQTNEAEKCYHLAVTNRVPHPDELNALATFCAQHGWLEDALTALNEASVLSPDEPAPPFNAGMVLMRLADRAGAAGDASRRTELRNQAGVRFAKAIQIDPDFMQAHFQYGLVTSDPQEAVRQFQAAARLAPNVYHTHFNLAVALEHIGNTRDALTEYEEVLKLDPNNIEARQKVQELTPKQIP